MTWLLFSRDHMIRVLTELAIVVGFPLAAATVTMLVGYRVASFGAAFLAAVAVYIISVLVGTVVREWVVTGSLLWR